LFETVTRVGESAEKHQHPALGGKSLGPCDRRRILRHQLPGGGEVLNRVVSPPGSPECAADAHLSGGGAEGGDPLVHSTTRLLAEQQRAPGVAGHFGDLRPARQQVESVTPREQLRLSHTIPERERPVDMSGGLLIGVHALSLCYRLDGGFERGGQIAGGVPVICKLRGGARGRELGVRAQRPCDRRVEAQALAREGVVVHGLTAQRVTERVRHPMARWNENMILGRLAQPVGQSWFVKTADLSEKTVVGGASNDGCGSQHLLCGRRQALYSKQ